jgi:hypothetical protein
VDPYFDPLGRELTGIGISDAHEELAVGRAEKGEKLLAQRSVVRGEREPRAGGVQLQGQPPERGVGCSP